MHPRLTPRRFHRLFLERLEDRLPPGSLLGVAGGWAEAIPLLPGDPLAASDLAIVKPDREAHRQTPASQEPNLAGDTPSSILATNPFSFHSDSTEELGDRRLPANPAASSESIATGLAETGSRWNALEDLFAAVLSGAENKGSSPALVQKPGASVSGTTVFAGASLVARPVHTTSAVQPAASFDQALLEAMAGQENATQPVTPLSIPEDNPHHPTAATGPNGFVFQSQPALAESYGRLPLTFEANLGQTDEQVHFLSHGTGYTLFLTGTEAVLRLQKPAAPLTLPSPPAAGGEGRVRGDEDSIEGAVVRMEVVGARTNAEVIGRDELAEKANYFIGNDPDQWRTDIPTFGRIEYQNIYDGINLVYYGNQRQLEYDFVLQPGADPDTIALNFTGADHVTIDAAGNLLLDTAVGQIVQPRPFIYQEVNGTRQEVPGSFIFRGENQVGFTVGAYDPTRVLIIDPVLSYSSYHGGSGFDYGFAVTVDSTGAAYVTGETASMNFPTSAGAFQTAYQGGNSDVFVTKVNPAGTARVYSTYLGGSFGVNPIERGGAIAVDTTGNAYITGRTGSSDNPMTPGMNEGFPTTAGALRTAHQGGDFDAFVTKLNPTGTGLVYSTYLGGGLNDSGFGIVVDGGGSAHVTGGTASAGFPTTASGFVTLNQGTDAFYTRLNATGTGLLYSTFLGGGSPDRGNSIALDSGGNAYIAGHSFSNNMPTTGGVIQPSSGAAFGIDGFVAKFNPGASGAASLVYLTYMGGGGLDFANGIAVDAMGNAYLVGETDSIDNPSTPLVNEAFPTTAGAFQTTFQGGINDAWAAKINPTATALLYSTYLGGGLDDRGNGIVINSAGNAFVNGFTNSTDYPTFRAIQPGNGGGYDAFLTQFNPTGTGLVYSTYLGGSGDENQPNSGDTASGLALDGSGGVYLAGRTASSNFPTRTPFQATFGGVDDAFVAKIVDDATAPLSVSGFSPTPTGFIADFNRQINPDLNLYDLATGGPGPADITVTGSTPGVPSGSLVVDATGTRITYIHAGGLLPADTYTVTFRSAANAFRDTSGGLLDGNRDGTVGDNFTTMFTVAASTTPVVSIPDFARGPRQPVNVPATAMRLPLNLSNGSGVRNISLVLRYNPALLTISGAVLPPPQVTGALDGVNNIAGPNTELTDTLFTGDLTGLTITLTSGPASGQSRVILSHVGQTITVADYVTPPVAGNTYTVGLPAGVALTVNTQTPGRAVLMLSSPTNLPARAFNFAELVATVADVPLANRSSHVLDITSLVLDNGFGGLIASRDDDALHAVTYFGETTGNGAYGSADATLVLRVATGLDTGFANYLRTSPLILADINRNGLVNAADATAVLQEAVGIDRGEIPPIV